MARTTFDPARIVVYEVDQPNDGLRLYRIVRSDNDEDPVFVNSFRSHYELGAEPRHVEARSAAMHMGLSMYTTRDRAIGTAARFRRIGGYVAEVVLRRGRGINLARTGHPGHITVWGRPEQLVELVRDIYPVDR